MPLGEGILLDVDRLGRRTAGLAARAAGALAGDDRAVSAERVDAQFGQGQPSSA